MRSRLALRSVVNSKTTSSAAAAAALAAPNLTTAAATSSSPASAAAPSFPPDACTTALVTPSSAAAIVLHQQYRCASSSSQKQKSPRSGSGKNKKKKKKDEASTRKKTPPPSPPSSAAKAAVGNDNKKKSGRTPSSSSSSSPRTTTAPPSPSSSPSLQSRGVQKGDKRKNVTTDTVLATTSKMTTTATTIDNKKRSASSENSSTAEKENRKTKQQQQPTPLSTAPATSTTKTSMASTPLQQQSQKRHITLPLIIPPCKIDILAKVRQILTAYQNGSNSGSSSLGASSSSPFSSTNMQLLLDAFSAVSAVDLLSYAQHMGIDIDTILNKHIVLDGGMGNTAAAALRQKNEKNTNTASTMGGGGDVFCNTLRRFALEFKASAGKTTTISGGAGGDEDVNLVVTVSTRPSVAEKGGGGLSSSPLTPFLQKQTEEAIVLLAGAGGDAAADKNSSTSKNDNISSLIRASLIDEIVRQNSSFQDEVARGLAWEVSNVLTSGRGKMGTALTASGVMVGHNSLSPFEELQQRRGGGGNQKMLTSTSSSMTAQHKNKSNIYRQVTAGVQGRLAAQEMAIYLVHFEPIYSTVDAAATAASSSSKANIISADQKRDPKAMLVKQHATAANQKTTTPTTAARVVTEVVAHFFCPLRNTMVLSHRMALTSSSLPPPSSSEMENHHVSTTTSSSSGDGSGSGEAVSGMMASILMSDMLGGGAAEGLINTTNTAADSAGSNDVTGSAPPAAVTSSSSLSDSPSARRQKEWEFVERMVGVSRGLTKVICIPIASPTSAQSSSSSCADVDGGDAEEWLTAAQQRLHSVLTDNGVQCACDVSTAGLVSAMLRSHEMRGALQRGNVGASNNNANNTNQPKDGGVSTAAAAADGADNATTPNNNNINTNASMGGSIDPLSFDLKHAAQNRILLERMAKLEGRGERDESGEGGGVGEKTEGANAVNATTASSQAQTPSSTSPSSPSSSPWQDVPLTPTSLRNVLSIALRRFHLTETGEKEKIAIKAKANNKVSDSSKDSNDAVIAAKAVLNPSLLTAPSAVFPSATSAADDAVGASSSSSSSPPAVGVSSIAPTTTLWHKDSIDAVINALTSSSSPSSSASSLYPANPLIVATLQCWFRNHWRLLSLCCAHSGIDGTPFAVVGGLVMPRAEVHAINLVQHGSKGISLSLYSTATERKRVASGTTMVVIVRELLALPTHHLILIPTERTDRQLLKQARAMLAKEGRLCSIIYPSMLMPDLGGLRNFKSNFPDLFWNEVQERTNLSAADLAWELRYMAGRQLRLYLTHKDDALASIIAFNNRVATTTSNSTTAADEDEDADGGDENEGEEEMNSGDGAVAAQQQQRIQQDVTASPTKWLNSFLKNPIRDAKEAEAFNALNQKYLFLTAIATDFNGYGRSNNPTLPQSRLLAAAWQDYKGDGSRFDASEEDEGHVGGGDDASSSSSSSSIVLPTTIYKSRSAFKFPDLSDYDLLVLHDAKAVLLHVWDHPELKAFFARGGRVWCTMVAEYLLSGQQVRSGQNSLLEVAMRHGNSYSAEAASLFSSIVGINRDQLPLSLLSKIALISSRLLSETFHSQLRQAFEQKQLISCAARMDAVLVMAEMEHCGLSIDLPACASRAKDLNNRLLTIEDALENLIPKQVPCDSLRNLDWSSPQLIRAYLFGGSFRLGQASIGRYVPVTHTIEIVPPTASSSQSASAQAAVSAPKTAVGGVGGADSVSASSNDQRNYERHLRDSVDDGAFTAGPAARGGGGITGDENNNSVDDVAPTHLALQKCLIQASQLDVADEESAACPSQTARTASQYDYLRENNNFGGPSSTTTTPLSSSSAMSNAQAQQQRSRQTVSYQWVPFRETPLLNEIIVQMCLRFSPSLVSSLAAAHAYAKEIGLKNAGEINELLLRSYFYRRAAAVRAGQYLRGGGGGDVTVDPSSNQVGNSNINNGAMDSVIREMIQIKTTPAGANAFSKKEGVITTAHLQDFISASAPAPELSSASPFSSQRFPMQQTNMLVETRDLAVRERILDYLRQFRLVFFDIEATGLNPAVDDIVELAFYDPATGNAFNSLLKPERPIPNRVTRIHQITQTMVKNAPSALDVLPRVIQFLGLKFENTPSGVAACRRLGLEPDQFVKREEDFGTANENVVFLVGHSCFNLDEPMLRKMFRLVPELDTNLVVFADSVPLFRYFKRTAKTTSLDKGLLQSLRLQDLTNAFGLKEEGESHRAIGDAKMLWRSLVAAFNLTTHPQPVQALLGIMIEQIRHDPSSHCLAHNDLGERKGVTFSLPGVAHQYLTPRQLEKASLQGVSSSSSTSRGVSNDTLQLLANKGCFGARLLLERQTLERHASKFLQFSDSGSIVILHPDRCVRQEIDMAATSTSRTTSSSPSCQNIPKGDDDSLIRSIYVSRYGVDGRCVEIDYGQLEIGVLAILSNDAQLLKELNEGVDFHCKRAAFFEHAKLTMEVEAYRKRATAEVIAKGSLDKVFVDGGRKGKDDANPKDVADADNHDVFAAQSAAPAPKLKSIEELYTEIYDGCLRGEGRYVAMRRQAKIVSFQRMYGGGVHLIHKTTRIPLPVLKEAIEEEERQYPNLKKFYALVRKTCLRVENPGLPTHFTFELPTGFRISFSPRDVKHSLPPMKNYPIQGYSAELVQIMMGKLFRHFASTTTSSISPSSSTSSCGQGLPSPHYGNKAHIVNFVHDSVWIDCHKDVFKTVVLDAVKILGDMPRIMNELYGGNGDGNGGVRIPIEMPVVAQAGRSFGNIHTIMRTTHRKGELIVNERAFESVATDGGASLELEAFGGKSVGNNDNNGSINIQNTNNRKNDSVGSDAGEGNAVASPPPQTQEGGEVKLQQPTTSESTTASSSNDQQQKSSGSNAGGGGGGLRYMLAPDSSFTFGNTSTTDELTRLLLLQNQQQNASSAAKNGGGSNNSNTSHDAEAAIKKASTYLSEADREKLIVVLSPSGAKKVVKTAPIFVPPRSMSAAEKRKHRQQLKKDLEKLSIFNPNNAALTAGGHVATTVGELNLLRSGGGGVCTATVPQRPLSAIYAPSSSAAAPLVPVNAFLPDEEEIAEMEYDLLTSLERED